LDAREWYEGQRPGLGGTFAAEDGQVAAKAYAFRRPRFPMVYAVGRALLGATSPAALRRQLRRLDPPGRRT